LAAVLRVIDDVAGPLSWWPDNVRHALLSGHWKYKDRFVLAAFFVGNGIEPNVLWRLAAAARALRDHDAHRHMASVLHRVRYDVEFRARTYTFDLYVRQYLYLNGEPVTHLLRLPTCSDCGVGIWWWEAATVVHDHNFCAACMLDYALIAGMD